MSSAKFYTARDGHTVWYGQHKCQCDCPTWATSFNRNANATEFPPSCKHILEMLNNRADEIMPGYLNIIVLRNPPIAMNVKLEETPDSDLLGCKVLYGINQFLGYLPKSSSRMDIRELLWPVLLGEYSMRNCPVCKIPNMPLTRIEAQGFEAQRIAVYMAAHIAVFEMCPNCKIRKDLIPNGSPDPPPNKKKPPTRKTVIMPAPVRGTTFTTVGTTWTSSTTSSSARGSIVTGPAFHGDAISGSSTFSPAHAGCGKDDCDYCNPPF